MAPAPSLAIVLAASLPSIPQWLETHCRVTWMSCRTAASFLHSDAAVGSVPAAGPDLSICRADCESMQILTSEVPGRCGCCRTASRHMSRATTSAWKEEESEPSGPQRVDLPDGASMITSAPPFAMPSLAEPSVQAMMKAVRRSLRARAVTALLTAGGSVRRVGREGMIVRLVMSSQGGSGGRGVMGALGMLTSPSSRAVAVATSLQVWRGSPRFRWALRRCRTVSEARWWRGLLSGRRRVFSSSEAAFS